MTPDVHDSNWLAEEMKAYDSMSDQLLQDHHDKFVVIQGSHLAGVYDTDEAAFGDAMRRFGRGTPFLLRRVSAEVDSAEVPALALGLINAKLP